MLVDVDLPKYKMWEPRYFSGTGIQRTLMSFKGVQTRRGTVTIPHLFAFFAVVKLKGILFFFFNDLGVINTIITIG